MIPKAKEVKNNSDIAIAMKKSHIYGQVRISLTDMSITEMSMAEMFVVELS